jgi:hypothetical protein
VSGTLSVQNDQITGGTAAPTWGIGSSVFGGVGGPGRRLLQPHLENNMPTAPLYVVILITLITMVGIWATFNLNAELKKSYPSEWEQLGKPTLLSKKSIRQELRLIGFIALRKYRKLEDPRLSRFGDLIFVCASINFVLCVLWSFLPHRSGPWLM